MELALEPDDAEAAARQLVAMASVVRVDACAAGQDVAAAAVVHVDGAPLAWASRLDEGEAVADGVVGVRDVEDVQAAGPCRLAWALVGDVEEHDEVVAAGGLASSCWAAGQAAAEGPEMDVATCSQAAVAATAVEVRCAPASCRP